MPGRGKSISSKHQAAVTLGSAGGRVGGPARARALSGVQRRDIARKGGKATASKHKSA